VIDAVNREAEETIASGIIQVQPEEDRVVAGDRLDGHATV
jgi:hypothetical protein